MLPYKDRKDSKKEQVKYMFNSISKRYDMLNHILSLWIDIYWRKTVVGILKKHSARNSILDIATGTGDLAIEMASLYPEKIIGIDISDKMLALGKQKILKKKLEQIIHLEVGDSENLSFENGTFDAVTCAFGVRNFENLEKGLQEMYRVLKNNGIVLILEFSQPRIFIFQWIYSFYFSKIMPLIGKTISKDPKAYSYLFDSVSKFVSGEKFIHLLDTIGFKKIYMKKLTFGICTIYVGIK
ncbi:MAG: bifunctional demethylmenaquinone methyltransferase/2-methoxy-6-polyprenyl-1,4-benzoquinol methylase UbiE [Chitinophagaceae bacterium]|nr:bifunctional demethylmenaquinone methyltransferase/2-methoxy-6-polyprenyl-1,4-benzoquinol methylase UbiE [Chitinophagaceae bacterium]